MSFFFRTFLGLTKTFLGLTQMMLSQKSSTNLHKITFVSITNDLNILMQNSGIINDELLIQNFPATMIIYLFHQPSVQGIIEQSYSEGIK